MFPKQKTKNKNDKNRKTDLESFYVHRARCIKWEPSGIRSLEFHPSGDWLAVGRENGDLEIWNTSLYYSWYCETRIAGTASETIEKIVWSLDGKRLFSCSLGSHVIEWSLTSLKAKTVCDSFGGAVRDLKLNHKGDTIAIACEDGRIRLFDISNGNFQYIRAFSKEKNSLFCLCWSENDSMIVAGGNGSNVSVYNTSTGRVINSIIVRKYSEIKSLVVWACLWVGNTIVCGDSHGYTRFYDAKFGTLLNEFKEHEADVLSLINIGDNEVYATGIDSKISKYSCKPFKKKTKKTKKKKNIYNEESDLNQAVNWICLYTRKELSQYLRSVIVHPIHKFLVVGGLSGQIAFITVKKFAKEFFTRVYPYPNTSIITKSRDNLLLSQFDDHLEIWKVGDIKKSKQNLPKLKESPNGMKIKIEKQPLHLLDLNTSKYYNIVCSAISSNGKFIAYSDQSGIKLFYLSVNKKNYTDFQLKKISLDDLQLNSIFAHKLTFTNDSSRLIIATSNLQIIVIEIIKKSIENSESENFTFQLIIKKVFDCYSNKIIKKKLHNKMDNGNDEDGNIKTNGKGKGKTKGKGKAKGKGNNGIKDTIEYKKTDSRIKDITVSSDGQYLASTDLKGNINIFNLDRLTFEKTLPTFDANPTVIKFQPNSSILTIVLSNNNFHFYNIEKNQLDDLSPKYFPKVLQDNKVRIFGISFDPKDETKLLLYCYDWIIYVDLNRIKVFLENEKKSIQNEKNTNNQPSSSAKDKKTENKKKKRRQNSKNKNNNNNNNSKKNNTTNSLSKTSRLNYAYFKGCRMLNLFQPLLFADYIHSGSLVVVERVWMDISKDLPTIKRKKFGYD
ncbi:u3 small nucleolar RNA-associated protein [Anaeramoeba flamelloides]|uniref:U3 small nucleolar RNA-associated protein n=1 Tax=Anaeramoeba flamelloides TaxID=1746091 RepID=A0ABQ8YHG4_9EUKA|nr:u3 small nucleolar RNA-associated protein [Anaeramoeba flamelloides]